MSQTDRDLERFKAACDYPGVLDEQAVEHELAAYLRALDLRRQIVRLRPGWRLEDHPPLKRHVELVLDTWAKRHLDAADVPSALAAADGSNLEDLDEPAIDTRDPPANVAFTLPEVLDGLAHAAAGKAGKTYDAFDRRYRTARWILRFVLPVVSAAVFFAVLFRADDPRLPLVGLFFIFVIANAALAPLITTLIILLARMLFAVKADDEGGFRRLSRFFPSVIGVAVFLLFFGGGGSLRIDDGRFSFLGPFFIFAIANAVLASIVTILIILARTPSAIKAGDEATFRRLLRVLAFVSPVASFAVSLAFVVGSGSKLPTDNPIFSSYFGLFVIAVLAVVVFARVITTLARMPSDIKAEDEAALMARFAASTARTVNKFLDSIPSSRDLTSLQGFAVWCIQARGWDLSDKAPALLEARWLRKSFAMAWARPLFEAFAAGCWLIYWTEDTLYWCAKPVVHRDRAGWLHDDRHAAVENEVEELYFWHGVRVPAFVVLRPDRITVGHIDREANAEVRRVMVERYRHGEEVHGAAAFIRDAGAVRLDHDERYGTLWRRNVPSDEPIVAVEVVNSTRAPDGSFKRYWLRVPPEMSTAREAVAWTFGLRATQYAPVKET